MKIDPIGFFKAAAQYPYDVPRQGSVEDSQAVGVIQLNSGFNFEQALSDLAGFERIWIIYEFHHNQNWKPKTLPPRGPHIKRGVFATRSPYRPNPIGISCVRLLKVDGLKLFVQEFDLLNETPILDIKPYIPYADSFPGAKAGWVDEIQESDFTVNFESTSEQKLKFLETNGMGALRAAIVTQLQTEPIDTRRKRVEETSPDQYCFSYRTWRVHFSLNTETKSVTVHDLTSGYSNEDLMDENDPHHDKPLHRRFKSEHS